MSTKKELTTTLAERVMLMEFDHQYDVRQAAATLRLIIGRLHGAAISVDNYLKRFEDVGEDNSTLDQSEILDWVQNDLLSLEGNLCINLLTGSVAKLKAYVAMKRLLDGTELGKEVDQKV